MSGILIYLFQPTLLQPIYLHTHVTHSAVRSPMDGRLFLAYPHDSGALSQSFDELHLFDDTSADLVSVSYICCVLM